MIQVNVRRAAIEGGTVEVLKAPRQYAGGTRYTLFDAAGGVSGTFAALGQDLPFLDLLLGYDTNHVYLDVQRNDVDFNIVCDDGTFNQCQVAGALDRIAGSETTGDVQATLTEVTTLDLPGAQAAFDRLSGEAHGSLTGLLLEGHAMYGQAVSRRIAERRDETGADRLHGGAWVRAHGNSSDLDGDGNAHAADFEQRGPAVGFDAWGDEHWLIGASFNAMSLDADFRPGDRGEADARMRRCMRRSKASVRISTSSPASPGGTTRSPAASTWAASIARRAAITAAIGSRPTSKPAGRSRWARPSN